MEKQIVFLPDSVNESFSAGVFISDRDRDEPEHGLLRGLKFLL